MSWLDKLEAHGKTQVREAQKKRTRPLVQHVYITVRQPKDNDPGEVAIGYYVVEGGMLKLTDENGTALEKQDPQAIGDRSPGSLASHLTWKRWNETRSGFNRRIDYPSISVV